MTQAVYLFVSILIVWALWRRPQVITITMAAAFLFAVEIALFVKGDALRSILMGADAIVVVVMWFLWSKYHSERAAMIATLGFVKIWFGIAAAVVGFTNFAWAAGNNAIFIVMVLISGGFLDGFIAWLGHSHSRLGTRWRGLLGYLEKVR